ncbi:hypothetical protein [Acinetobacter sp. HY1485]|uniref:hypothetical protein n=1 Tax=Acinetobacter sp. HY1485 TaxID=2970918 RepID=UPI0022B9AF3E|nr:hypothetical protein [Acinetobacter sp. HY1485]
MSKPSAGINFGEYLRKGLENSENKDKNIDQIKCLIKELNHQIQAATDKKVGIMLCTNLRAQLTNFALGLKSVEDTEAIKLQEIYAYSISNANEKKSLTKFDFGPQGFPCTIYVDGNRMTAGDIESLQENLGELLSSARTGRKISELLKL